MTPPRVHFIAGKALLQVLSVLLVLLTVSARSQMRIDLNPIGEAAFGERQMLIDEEETLSGTFLRDAESPQQYLIRAAWRRLDEETWRIVTPAFPVAADDTRRVTWSLEDVPLGNSFDVRKGLEVVAFVIAADQPFPDGIIDFASLARQSLAVSPPVIAYRKSRAPGTLMVTPRIRIDHIDGEAIRRGALHGVGLTAVVTGEVRKPTFSQIRIVLQPLHRDEYWVQEEEPLVRYGIWTGRANFVNHRFDEESDFSMMAVVTRHELPRGRAIDLAEWRRLLESHISGISNAVRVTRTEIPPSQNDIGTRILTVDDQPAGMRYQLTVPRRSAVKGLISGRLLTNDEAIWVLAADPFTPGSWRPVGQAAVKNERFWELPPRPLGAPGAYLKLMAVVAPADSGQLRIDQAEQNIAFSKPVHVLVAQAPELQLTIQSIDEKAVRDVGQAQVERISSIEGDIGGRPLEDDDRIWILKMNERNPDEWELVGQAGMRSQHRWALPPIALGESGDKLILMAVVSKSRIERMNIDEQGAVRATSSRIHVRLVD